MPAQNLPGRLLDRTHPLSRGLVGYWPMNEGAGANVLDVVRRNNNNNGTLTNAPKRAGGMGAGALAFDAASTQYVSFQNMAALFSTEATFSVWVKRELHTPISAATAGCWEFGFVGSASHYPWMDGAIYDNTFLATRVTVGNVGIADRAKWHLVTITSTPGAGGWKFWQNGAVVFTSTGDSTVYIPPIPKFGWSNFEHYYQGHMHGLRLYNRALSAPEVMQLYQQPHAGLLSSRASSLYRLAFRAAWAARANQIIGGSTT